MKKSKLWGSKFFAKPKPNKQKSTQPANPIVTGNIFTGERPTARWNWEPQPTPTTTTTDPLGTLGTLPQPNGYTITRRPWITQTTQNEPGPYTWSAVYNNQFRYINRPVEYRSFLKLLAIDYIQSSDTNITSMDIMIALNNIRLSAIAQFYRKDLVALQRDLAFTIRQRKAELMDEEAEAEARAEEEGERLAELAAAETPTTPEPPAYLPEEDNENFDPATGF